VGKTKETGTLLGGQAERGRQEEEENRNCGENVPAASTGHDGALRTRFTIRTKPCFPGAPGIRRALHHGRDVRLHQGDGYPFPPVRTPTLGFRGSYVNRTQIP